MRISDWSSDVCSSDLVRSALALETKFQPRVIRFGLGETNPGDRRKSKGNARHPFVIGLAVSAVDKIGSDDFCSMAGNRSEWGSGSGSIPGRVEGWHAHALQKIVEIVSATGSESECP